MIQHAAIYRTSQDLDRAMIHGKVIFTNGCFDILHAGHVQYLTQAKALGDTLILGLNHDASVRHLKGPTRPINTWADRATVLASLRCIDIIVGFDEENPIELIKTIRPDVICKGGDYKIEEMIGRDFVASYGGEVVILPFVEGYSTTEMLKRQKG